MEGAVTQLWRYPIKSHGREALERTDLRAGEALPWDRFWAVMHDQSSHDGVGWASCQNFMIGARTPGLAGIWATLNEDTRRVTLRHDRLGEIAIRPDDPMDAAQLLAWVAPLVPENRAQPLKIVSAGARGLTDSDYASISLMNAASHRAVSQKLGHPLEEERWRGNIWFDGLAPWEEFDWIGKTLRIGSAIVEVREPIERCVHTTANPRSGERDADTLGTLEAGWDHRDFGVYAVVLEPGEVAIGDQIGRA